MSAFGRRHIFFSICLLLFYSVQLRDTFTAPVNYKDSCCSRTSLLFDRRRNINFTTFYFFILTFTHFFLSRPATFPLTHSERDMKYNFLLFWIKAGWRIWLFRFVFSLRGRIIGRGVRAFGSGPRAIHVCRGPICSESGAVIISFFFSVCFVTVH